LEQHLTAWERLNAEAEEKAARYDAFHQIAQQVDAQFALIDLESAGLRDSVASFECLRDLGKQLRGWDGRIYKKLSRNLTNWAEGLFRYQPVLKQALSPLVEQWGTVAIQALSRIWQIEADEKRRPLPLLERYARRGLWEESLDDALALLGEDQLWEAWDALSAVLSRSWRGSMLAECINSLLRPVLDGRKHTDQGCLELFRFLHNVRSFKRGKRAGHSPAQLVKLDVPGDPLTLLGLAPKVETVERTGVQNESLGDNGSVVSPPQHLQEHPITLPLNSSMVKSYPFEQFGNQIDHLMPPGELPRVHQPVSQSASTLVCHSFGDLS